MGGQGLTPAVTGALAGVLGAGTGMAIAGAATIAAALALRGPSPAAAPRPLEPASRIFIHRTSRLPAPAYPARPGCGSVLL
jgi:hypothetical protein